MRRGFLHRLGSLPVLYRFSGRVAGGLLPVTLALLGAGMVWGLLVAPPDYRQGDAFRIVYFHVPASVTAMGGYYVMAAAGAVSLIWRMKAAAMTLRCCAPIGAALTFLGLVSGAIWGKPTWGAWWVWDARVTSMLFLLFLYLGVVALHQAYADKAAAAKAGAVLSLVGTVNIPIIYKSVDWWHSLHQPSTIRFTEASAMHEDMLRPLLLMIVAFYCLFACSLLLSLRAEILRREAGAGWVREMLSAKPRCAKEPRHAKGQRHA